MSDQVDNFDLLELDEMMMTDLAILAGSEGDNQDIEAAGRVSMLLLVSIIKVH